MDEFAAEREGMVRHLINEGYLRSNKVIEVFRDVPRHLFVPDELRRNAYDDCPLPIGSGQTISAPHMVAIMTELLEPRKTDVVLEIGAGSGWQAAILSRLVKSVHTIELDGMLAASAAEKLIMVKADNVKVMQGDGARGYAKAAPFDKIIVTCACGKVPSPLFEQLKVGGILIAPVGGSWLQELRLYRKTKNGMKEENHGSVVFVPLRGG